MESKNIIFGSLALVVVGGGAYFFLKNKRLKDASKLAELEKLGQGVNIGVATAGGSTTPDKVLASAPVTNAPTQAELDAKAKANQQELVNLTQATSLINQIISLRKTKKSIPFTTFFNSDEVKSSQEFNVGIDNQIANIKAQMKLLGYEEKNGLAVKI
jgi:hypothetical protein